MSAVSATPPAPAAVGLTAKMMAMLEKQAITPAVRNSIPLDKYYTTASDLRTQAQVYQAEHDHERAYVFYKRFVQTVLLTIPAHNACNQVKYRKDKAEFRKFAEDALTELETLKKTLKEKYEKLEAEGGDEDEEADEQEEDQGEPVQQLDASPSAPPADDVSSLPDQLQELKVDSTNPPSAPPSMNRQTSWDNLTYAPAARQTSWDNLKLPFNAGPVQPKPKPAPSTTSAPSRAMSAYPPLRTAGPQSNGTSRPQLSAAPAQQQQQVAKPKPRSSSSTKSLSSKFALREVHMPGSVLTQFLDYVKDNTRADIETCGILTGVLKDNKFLITTIVIPKQEATANTCVTHSEEDLFELQDKKGLLTLGWIHTHPSQTCFLSSIDLHTHFSYQVMLAEAIAVVLAPTAKPDSGVFSLSPKGIEVLGSCDRRGFHRHNDDEGLYGLAPHCKLDWSRNAKCTIIDLRHKHAH